MTCLFNVPTTNRNPKFLRKFPQCSKSGHCGGWSFQTWNSSEIWCPQLECSIPNQAVTSISVRQHDGGRTQTNIPIAMAFLVPVVVNALFGERGSGFLGIWSMILVFLGRMLRHFTVISFHMILKVHRSSSIDFFLKFINKIKLKNYFFILHSFSYHKTGR